MIEMLGVLAIIAVLSVGGIAGYSKAMQKYKINKWKENVVTLLSNLNIAYAQSRSFTTSDNQDMISTYKEIGIIPSDMLSKQNKDIFNNQWQIYSFTVVPWHTGSRLFLRFRTNPDNNAYEVCKETFSLLLSYDDIWAVVLNEYQSSWLTVCGKAAPVQYCKNMHAVDYSLTVIAEKCAVCTTQNCDINLVISNGY